MVAAMSLVCSVLLYSCKPHAKGAVVFSFDDQYIEEWFAHRDLFKKYDIKASFFITRPHLLSAEQIKMLRILIADGHEIGNHSLTHKSALDYADSIEVYIEKEVLAANKIFNSLGIEIVSFSYPYGASDSLIDNRMGEMFKYLRKATWDYKDTLLSAYPEIFARPDNYTIVNAMGIDNNYRISEESLKSGLLRAKENNEVLILYAHIIDTLAMDYVISPQSLESAFQMVNQMGIKSIRLKDLEDYYNP